MTDGGSDRQPVCSVNLMFTFLCEQLAQGFCAVSAVKFCMLCCMAGVSARTARVLVVMVIPGQLIFIGLIYAMQPHSESVEITPLFVVVYIIAAVIQVMIDLC